MSTRCQIMVGHPGGFSQAVVYRHQDGYPEGEHGVLATLVPIVRNVMRYRGYDKAYMTAHIAHGMIELVKKSGAKFRRQWRKDHPGEKLRDHHYSSDYLSNGVEGFDGLFHGDIEFLYCVMEDGIEVRIPRPSFWGASSFDNTMVKFVVDFNGKKK